MNHEELFKIIQTTKWEKPEYAPEGVLEMKGTQENGCPVVLHNHCGHIWLDVTVFDEELDDGREIEFEIVQVN